MNGIDVSKYQGNIDWNKVKADGVEFVIIRAGYGKNTIDSYFKKNIEGAIAAGLKVGIYWFLYCINEAEAIQNADMCHSVIEPYKDKITMKVWCDLEYDTETKANRKGVIFTKELRTNIVKVFCERLKSHDYEVGYYTNQDYLKNKFGDLSMYPLWLARYSKSKGNYDCELLQYSSKGSVNGIKGNVDMNICYAETKMNELTIDHNPFTEPKTNIKKGCKGEGVKWVQWFLWRFGLIAKDDIDGIFGQQTDVAVREAQKRLGLVIDGIVGKNTRNTWKSLL